MPTADHADTRFPPRLHACQRQPGPVTRALAAMRNEPTLSPATEAEWEAAARQLERDLADLIAEAGDTDRQGGRS